MFNHKSFRSFFGRSSTDRRRSLKHASGPMAVEILESRTLLTLIGMTATVNSTVQSDVQTGGLEVPAGAAVSAVVNGDATAPEFVQFAGKYDIDIAANSISMNFNLANGTADPSGIVQPGTFHRYYFKFDVASNESIASAVNDPSASLTPNIRVVSRDTVVVEVAPGMRVGNGFNALINVQVARTGTVITGRKFNDFNKDGAHSSGEAWLNGWEVNLIDINQDSNVVATTTTADIDLNGDGDIDPASERGVYEFANMAASTYLVQEVQRDGWIRTRPSSPAEAAAYQLDQSVDLRPTGSSFLNWGGKQEKWLYGSGSWYFVTPDGGVNQWNGSARTNLTGVPVAQLDETFYNDLSKLFDAPSPRQYIVDIDVAANVTHRGLDFGNYLAAPDFSFVQNSDNTVTFTWDDASGLVYQVWISDISAGRRYEVTEGISGSSFTSGVLPDRRYRVWMQASTDDGTTSPWSASQEFEFTKDALVNPVTAGLNAGIDATPTLTIAPVPAATSYDVRVTNAAGTVVYEANGGVSHRVSKPLRLASYTVSVRANFADGSRNAWSAAQTLVIDGRPTVNFSGGTLSWNAVAGATEYDIWIDRLDATGRRQDIQVVRIEDLRQTSYTPQLPAGDYTVWVRAIRSEDGTRHPSFWSFQSFFGISSSARQQVAASASTTTTTTTFSSANFVNLEVAVPLTSIGGISEP